MNPVKLQNKSKIKAFGIVLLLILLLLAIVITAATPDVDESCIGLKILLFILPVWLFLYYRLYSRILIMIMDTLTCECAEHGKGYAVFHYFIWATIGHPFICFGPFVYITMNQVADIFSTKTCTINTTSSLTIFVWEYGFLIIALMYLFIVICSGILVSYKNHEDVKFQLHWKEQNESQRENAISKAISVETNTNNPFNLTSNANIANNNNNNNSNNNDVNNQEDEQNASEAAFGDVNIEEFEAKHNIGSGAAIGGQSSDFPLSQSTEEQIRMAIAASIHTAKDEENQRNDTDDDNPPPLPGKDGVGNASVSMSGFWAKGQQISSALLGNMFSDQNYECIVCYEDYEIGHEIAKLKCGHKMHKKCAKEWLAHNPTCPFCRVNVLRKGLY